MNEMEKKLTKIEKDSKATDEIINSTVKALELAGHYKTAKELSKVKAILNRYREDYKDSKYHKRLLKSRMNTIIKSL